MDDHARCDTRKFGEGAKDCVFRYPGIKEDVYVPFFEPDPNVREILGEEPSELVVTIRPPAIESHYHNPLSQTLFETSVDRIVSKEVCGLSCCRAATVRKNQ